MKKPFCILIAFFMLLSFSGCSSLSYEDTIVHDFALNEENQQFTLENVTGKVSLKLAGESAGYTVSYTIS